MADSLIPLLRQTTVASLGKRVQGEWFNKAVQAIAEIEQAITAYHQQATETMSSADFTEQGRAKELQRLSQRTLASLASVEKTLQRYRAEIDNARQHAASLAPAPLSDIAQLRQELRSAEIRRSLPVDDALRLRMVYEQAVRDGHNELLVAIEEAPIRLLPQEILDQGASARALRAVPPEVRGHLEALEACEAAVRQVWQTAKREAGEQPSDELIPVPPQ
jgi:hypothetical protein